MPVACHLLNRYGSLRNALARIKRKNPADVATIVTQLERERATLLAEGVEHYNKRMQTLVSISF